MARDSLWKGFLAFGLVEIPVELVNAEQSDDISFHLFDRRDHAPVGNRRVNKTSGDEVPWSDVVKGYEYSPDEYVMLSDEELKSANPKATQTIEILDFVDADEVHPIYFDKPYYLRASRKRGQKAYALLHATLKRTGRMGIARLVLRTKQHLAALTLRDEALVLCLLRFDHELVAPSEIGLGDESPAKLEVSKKEIDMAARLVEDMTGAWKPERYKDAYRDDVLAMIERKVKSGKLEAIEQPAPESETDDNSDVLDLMPLLKRSLEGKGGRPAGKKPAPSRASRAKTNGSHRPAATLNRVARRRSA